MLFLLACGSDPQVTDADTGLAAEVVINELLADRSAGGDWVELYNSGGSPVSLDGYALTDGEERRSLPEGLRLEPGAFLAIACGTQLAGFTAEVELDLNKDGDSLTLEHFEGDEAVVEDEVSWESLLGGMSAARSPDGGIEWVYDATPTPGATND